MQIIRDIHKGKCFLQMEISRLGPISENGDVQQQEMKTLRSLSLAERCKSTGYIASKLSSYHRTQYMAGNIITICVGIAIFIVSMMYGVDIKVYTILAFLGLLVSAIPILSFLLFSSGLNNPHARFIRMEEYRYRLDTISSQLRDNLHPDVLTFYQSEIRDLELLIGIYDEVPEEKSVVEMA